MLSSSELVDRLVSIADAIAELAGIDAGDLTAGDGRRFDALVREFDVYDTARIGLDVGVREEHLPLIVSLLTG